MTAFAVARKGHPKMSGAWLSSLVIFISMTKNLPGNSNLLISRLHLLLLHLVSLLIHLLSITLLREDTTPLHDDGLNTTLERMLILAPVSSKDLVNDIPPISLVIMSAPGTLFVIDLEFIMIELTISLSWILLGFL